MYLAQIHNALTLMRLEPVALLSQVKHSTTELLHFLWNVSSFEHLTNCFVDTMEHIIVLCEKAITCLVSLRFYHFFPNLFINFIKHKDSCKILYICNKRSIHARASMSASEGSLMKDPLCVQQEEHSCKIIYICNKRRNLVR